MAGLVVRGIAGRRDRYQPLASPLVSSPQPAELFEAFLGRLGFRELYLADLDAIGGAPAAWSVYESALSYGARLWVDAGPRDIESVSRLREFQFGERSLDGVVLGLESLDRPERVADLFDAAGGVGRAIFSLDLRDEVPLVTSENWHGWSAERIADLAVEIGFRRLIVLDLRRVGVGSGTGTESLLRTLSARHPQCEWIAGGGVRGRDDMSRLEACGCAAALVATALHSGELP